MKAVKCGHWTELRGSISGNAQGVPFVNKTIDLEIIGLLNRQGTIDCCLDCCAKMSIRCANMRCENLIHIGDLCTLRSPGDLNFEIPEYAIEHSDTPQLQLVGSHKHPEVPFQVVGCADGNCSGYTEENTGVWIPKNKKEGKVWLRGQIFSLTPVTETDISKRDVMREAS